MKQDLIEKYQEKKKEYKEKQTETYDQTISKLTKEAGEFMGLKLQMDSVQVSFFVLFLFERLQIVLQIVLLLIA